NTAVRLAVNTPSKNIFGHAALEGVIASAAVDGNKPGLKKNYRFGSQRAGEIFFSAIEGALKPDNAGFTGGAATLADFSTFFGTSAAAPHVAAVAALLLSKNSSLTPAQIKATLMTSAVDIGAPGFDSVAGAGRLDALAAANAVAPACPSDAAC